MIYFTDIKKTKHYVLNHEKNFSWFEVIRVILNSQKSIKKKNNKLEIETNNFYVLCEFNDNILYVINAKRK